MHTLPARRLERLVTRLLADLGNSPAVLKECIRQANGNAENVVEDLEGQWQSQLARLGEVNKGINRIVDYIRNHDAAPPEVTGELTVLDREGDEIRAAIEKVGLEIGQRQDWVLDADVMRQQLQDFEQLSGCSDSL